MLFKCNKTHMSIPALNGDRDQGIDPTKGAKMEYRSRTLLGTARRNLARRLRPDIRITPPPRGVTFDRDESVTMRDGIILRANVFRPKDEARHLFRPG